MARGHCLNILVVLAAVHGLLGLSGRSARSSLHSLFLPAFPLSPSLISNLVFVDVETNGKQVNILLYVHRSEVAY